MVKLRCNATNVLRQSLVFMVGKLHEVSLETRQKIGIKSRNTPRKPMSSETRLKISKAIKQSWVRKHSKTRLHAVDDTVKL